MEKYGVKVKENTLFQESQQTQSSYIQVIRQNQHGGPNSYITLKKFIADSSKNGRGEVKNDLPSGEDQMLLDLDGASEKNPGVPGD